MLSEDTYQVSPHCISPSRLSSDNLQVSNKSAGALFQLDSVSEDTDKEEEEKDNEEVPEEKPITPDICHVIKI